MHYHIIIVDDGSIDRSMVMRTFESFRLVHPHSQLIQYQENKGKGHALRTGLMAGQNPIAVYTDIDFPYEPLSVHNIARALTDGADVALGYRESDYYASVPWFRSLLSRAFRFVLKDLLRFPITDTQCGLKGMNSKGKEVFLATKIDRFLVDMEFVKRLSKSTQIAVQPVVVKLRDNIEFSAMGAGVLAREGLNFVRVLFT